MTVNQLHFIALTADPTIRQSLAGLFPREGWRFEVVLDAGALVDAATELTAAVLIDESSGSTYPSLIRHLRKTAPGVDAIVVGGPKAEAVRRDERRAAVDLYLERPIDPKAFRATLDHRLAMVAVKANAGIVGRSAALEELLASVLLVGPTEVPVLIQGESGTGKDVIARAIHSVSARRDGPFEAINCGSLAEGVLESELFGHEKGSFTGAVGRRAGMFERADRGTIFLDEVGETSPTMQVRLLRVLESGEVMRVGGVAALKVNVRVIAATNRNLSDAVRNGMFRQDLYYRLKGVNLYLPPLRERREDIALLAQHFITQANRTHRRGIRGIEPDALRRLEEHPWPGNIRELKNLIETLVVLSPGPRIGLALVDAHLADQRPERAGAPLLPVAIPRSREEAERELLYGSILALHRDVREILRVLREGGAGSVPGTLAASPFGPVSEVRAEDMPREPNVSLEQMERLAIRDALARTAGNRRRAADALGISERTLYRKIKEYGLA